MSEMPNYILPPPPAAPAQGHMGIAAVAPVCTTHSPVSDKYTYPSTFHILDETPADMTTKPPPAPREPLQELIQRVNQSPAKLPPQEGIHDTAAKPIAAAPMPGPGTWVERPRDLNAPANSEVRAIMERAITDSLPKAKAKPTTAQPAKPVAATGTSNKRKADTTTLEQDMAAYKQDLAHVDVDAMPVDMNCDQVRRRIHQVLDGGIMKKGEFCAAVGASPRTVNTFLQKRGPAAGAGSAAYHDAWAWFKKRDVAGLKMPDVKKREKAAAAAAANKKAKTTNDAGPAAPAVVPDLNQIHLPGEDTDAVPVFDTADEIRRKIAAHLTKTPGLTQAQFCRDLYAQLRAPACKAIQGKQLADFRAKKGPRAGCTSSVYYAAYVYFERLRIAQGRPKSAHRLRMEDMYGEEGMDRDDDGRHG